MDRSSAPVAERVRSWLPPSPWPIVPGLDGMRRYDRRTQLRPDLIAGLTPQSPSRPASAMGELAGLSPVAGLYATLVPLAAYCLFGSSRQLIVGDAILASVSAEALTYIDATAVDALCTVRADLATTASSLPSPAPRPTLVASSRLVGTPPNSAKTASSTLYALPSTRTSEWSSHDLRGDQL